MYSYRSQSLEDLYRYDNQYTQQYLVNCADILLAAGICSSKDIDNLQISLHQFILENVKSPQGLTPYLVRSHSEFLNLLIERHGLEGLHFNLLAQSLRPMMQQFIGIIRDLTESFLKVTRLNFNRHFMVFKKDHGDRYNQSEKKTLLSQFLLPKIEHLLEVISTVESLSKSFGVFIGNQMTHAVANDDSLVDNKIAESLEFETIEYVFDLKLKYLYMRNQLFSAINLFSYTISSVLEQMRANLNNPDAYAAGIQIQQQLLKSETDRLLGLLSSEEKSVLGLEKQRLAIIESFFSLRDIFHEIGNILSRELNQISHFKEPINSVIPKSLKRRMTYQLLQKQISLPKAQRAIDDLESYCLKNSVNFEHLIKEELGHINYDLSEENLKTLHEYSQSEMANQTLATQKAHTLNHLKELEKKLASISIKGAIPLLLVMICITFVSHCGLKSAPKSSHPALRPLLPFEEPNAK